MEELKNQLEYFESLSNELSKDLTVKEDRIVDLEFQLLSWYHGLNSNSPQGEKSNIDHEKLANFSTNGVEKRDREIERLEGELRKRTCDLQGLVNKELWEKNREIERMQNRNGDILAGKDGEIAELKKNVACKDEQLQTLKQEIEKMGVHISNEVKINENTKNAIGTINEMSALEEQREFHEFQIQELSQRVFQETDLEKWKFSYDQLMIKYEKCEKLRLEGNEVCMLLSTRLEELAIYLDSLLKQKLVLGLLGRDENTKIRGIIKQSLQISQNITISITENPNESLFQLTNISSLLNSSDLGDTSNAQKNGDNYVLPSESSQESLVYKGQLHLTAAVAENSDQNDIIAVLRTQIDNLKQEIELRDIEIDKLVEEKTVESVHIGIEKEVNVFITMQPDNSPCKIQSPKKIIESLMETEKSNRSTGRTPSTLKCMDEHQSESESWSEPDRTVSMARIGLQDNSLVLKPASASRKSRLTEDVTCSTEEEDISSQISRRSENTRQLVTCLQEKNAELKMIIKEKDSLIHELKEEFDRNESQWFAEYDRVNLLQEHNDELVSKNKELLIKYAEVEMYKTKIESQMNEMKLTIDDAKIIQDTLQETIDTKDKYVQSKTIQLELEKTEALKTLKELEATLKDSEDTRIRYEKELEMLRAEMIKSESLLKMNAQQELEQAVSAKDVELDIKIKNVEKNYAAKVKQLQQMLIEKYETQYVNCREVEKLRKTIAELEKVLKDKEKEMSNVQENEIKHKDDLTECHKYYNGQIESITEQLKNVTSMISETVLAKNNLIKERDTLQQRIDDFIASKDEAMQQVKQERKEYIMMRDVLEKTNSDLKQQKSNLEGRVQYLEKHNSDLRIKLIRLRCAIGPVSSNSNTRIHELFFNKTYPGNVCGKRGNSDHSGYTSEDIPNEARNSFPESKHDVQDIAPIDMARQQSSYSPDLGIESDHGRFSSLEVNVERPFLETLELTENMSNSLTQNLQIVTCSKYF